MKPELPVALTIAGSDSSAGAGIQADIKSFAALGCYGVSALTSVVAETPASVKRIQLLEPEIVFDQIKVLDGAFPIRAAKTGMLGGKAQIDAVIQAWRPLAARNVPLVVDPVMISTSGTRLLDDEAMTMLITRLFPLARVVTPNLHEAAVFVGQALTTRDDMLQAAIHMSSQWGAAVLLKGGHLAGDDCDDVLIDGDVVHWFEARRIKNVSTHGTGCTLSAAIAAAMARGMSLKEAITLAKRYTTAAISTHLTWGDTKALNHFTRGVGSRISQSAS